MARDRVKEMITDANRALEGRSLARPTSWQPLDGHRWMCETRSRDTHDAGVAIFDQKQELLHLYTIGETVSVDPDIKAKHVVLNTSQLVLQFFQRAGFSFRQLAEIVGVSASEISRIKHGNREWTMRQLQRLADKRNVPLWQMLQETTNIQPVRKTA